MATVPDPFASRPTTPNSSEGEQLRDNGYSSSSIGSNNGGPSSYLPHSQSSQNYFSPANEHLRPSHVSSPLNPHSPSRPDSRGSMSRIVSEESYTLGVGPGGYPYMSQRDASTSSRGGNMLLYRLASEPGAWDDEAPLPPPTTSFRNRFSTGSESGFSIHSTNSDSKYPNDGFLTAGKGAFLAYPYDPSQDQDSPPDDDDILHDPKAIDSTARGSRLNLRGFANMFVLAALVLGIICLFTLYPILSFFNNNSHNLAIENNVQVNGSGQVPIFPNLRSLVDQETPDNVKTRTGWDGMAYELVFSDEFNKDGRTFYPGDDPFFEAVELWYGATEDLEWYSADNAITANGSLQLVVEEADPESNHGLQYKSAMLQSWNKFCFSTGYIEFNVSLPGENSNVSGYWPGLWTMGNLGRAGYGASTDGLWPYSYDACDLGTFRNQTNQTGDGPPAALHTDDGRASFNFELSWLPGQRVSACTCPGSEHPGPNVGVGRGAPEIDVLEAEKNKLGVGGRVSQSAQFAPFSADYAYSNSTPSINLYTPDITRENSYHGSGLQQAISYLTAIPDDNYAGSGGAFVTYGFEYWSNPNDQTDGFITWSVNGQPVYQMTAATVPADPVAEISQRLISREPMSIVMNLAISASFQPVVIETLTFPAAFLIDYIRVYQRTGTQNGVGCNPPDFPTSQYINDHIEAYTNPNLTFWRGDPSTGFEAGYSWPKNSLFDGCS